MATAELTITAVFGIPPQMLGDVRDNPVPRGNWSFYAPPGGTASYSFSVITASPDEARRELREVLEKYPQSAPVLKQAIEGGRVNGVTFGSPRGGEPCCMIGWVMRAEQDYSGRSVFWREQVSGQYMMLQSYVRFVRSGETHQTPGSPLATLYAEIVAFMDEQQAEESLEDFAERISVEQAVALAERLLVDYSPRHVTPSAMHYYRDGYSDAIRQRELVSV